MARTKQTKKVKPFSSPERKLINKAIVKAKHKSVKKKAASVLASSHKDQKVGLFFRKRHARCHGPLQTIQIAWIW